MAPELALSENQTGKALLTAKHEACKQVDFASQICGIRRSLAGLEIGLIPMEIYRSNDEYHVTGVELNYGRVELPVTSANFI